MVHENECPNCGAKIDFQNKKSTYCEYCGSKLLNKNHTKVPENTNAFNGFNNDFLKNFGSGMNVSIDFKDSPNTIVTKNGQVIDDPVEVQKIQQEVEDIMNDIFD